MATDADVAEAKRLRPSIFPVTILGMGEAQQYCVLGRMMAARRGRNGHTAADVRELLEVLAWGDHLDPTPLAFSLIEGVMGRVRSYMEKGALNDGG